MDGTADRRGISLRHGSEIPASGSRRRLRDERSLMRLLKSYFDYYHRSRTHLSLEKDSPVPRSVMVGSERVIAIPKVGGLHHRYERAA
jgi:hypothetical protein